MTQTASITYLSPPLVIRCPGRNAGDPTETAPHEQGWMMSPVVAVVVVAGEHAPYMHASTTPAGLSMDVSPKIATKRAAVDPAVQGKGPGSLPWGKMEGERVAYCILLPVCSSGYIPLSLRRHTAGLDALPSLTSRLCRPACRYARCRWWELLLALRRTGPTAARLLGTDAGAIASRRRGLHPGCELLALLKMGGFQDLCEVCCGGAGSGCTRLSLSFCVWV